jgi:hypothetical protein
MKDPRNKGQSLARKKLQILVMKTFVADEIHRIKKTKNLTLDPGKDDFKSVNA